MKAIIRRSKVTCAVSEMGVRCLNPADSIVLEFYLSSRYSIKLSESREESQQIVLFYGMYTLLTQILI